MTEWRENQFELPIIGIIIVTHYCILIWGESVWLYKGAAYCSKWLPCSERRHCQGVVDWWQTFSDLSWRREGWVLWASSSLSSSPDPLLWSDLRQSPELRWLPSHALLAEPCYPSPTHNTRRKIIVTGCKCHLTHYLEWYIAYTWHIFAE